LDRNETFSIAGTELGKDVSSSPAAGVLVLGNVMVDEYVWGTVSRSSPEALVPVVAVRGESLKVGGAANMAANVGALRGRVLIAGVVGNDPLAEGLVHELE
jgi:bifunctional ADP-heptose synthase (sugar kinase/adenylyltransferase)